MTRLGRLLSLIALGGLSSACGGTQAKDVNAIENKVSAPVVKKPAVVTMADAQLLLPPSASIFFGADLTRLSEARVLSRYVSMLAAALPPEVGRMKAECGIDPMRDLDWVVGAVNDQGDGVFAVRGNYTRSQVESCVEKTGATIEQEGEVAIIRGADGDTSHVYWLGDQVALISNDSRALFDETIAIIDSGEASARVRGELGLIDTGAAVWMTISKSQQFAQIDGLTRGRLTIDADLVVELVFAADFVSNAKAMDMKNQYDMGLATARSQPTAAPFLPIVDKIKMAVTDNVLSGSLMLTEDDLVLLEQAATAMGMTP